LRIAPDARFLVTSRERLSIERERAHAVGPLGVPGDGEDRAAIARAEAVRLFVERARAARGELTLVASDTPVVGGVVRRVQGLPLAVELAAARSAILGAADILARLERRLDLLRARAGTTDPRHATLRAAIDWSWDLLSPAEQSALAQLSVFRGGFSIDAAEAV